MTSRSKGIGYLVFCTEEHDNVGWGVKNDLKLYDVIYA